MTKWHRQRVEILINQDTNLYRRIEKVAERDGVAVENVIDMMVMVGLDNLLEQRLPELENRRK